MVRLADENGFTSMRERKVYGLLKLLDSEEQELFQVYLGSPLFEQGEVMQRFLAC